jgi:taurine transport system permease protein
MLTQILTVLILATIIGSIIYGRKLIQTEKVDAVFGNPERAKGGTHWVILGSCTILLIWMYYSWDMQEDFIQNQQMNFAKCKSKRLFISIKISVPNRPKRIKKYCSN